MSSPLRFAYADPPYMGQASKHYRDHPDFAGEVDHAELLARLVDQFPDGWALSCSVPSLQYLLTLCPPDVRVCAWVKPFVRFKKGVPRAYAWEPVIVHGGRKLTADNPTVLDWVSAPITMRRGVVGAKPEAFCRWLFAFLGARPGDEMVDLFPGSGAVSEAWAAWSRQPELKAATSVRQSELEAITGE
jgi:hypothetical protein